MKVISILTHTPNSTIYEYKSPEAYTNEFPETEYIKLDKKPFWVGFFKKDWHHQWGSYLKKMAPEIEVECWRPYGNKIDRIFEKEVDGLKHKIFPSTELTIKKYGTIERSHSLLKELKKEIGSQKIIIHFYGSHTNLQIWILNRLKSFAVPVIVQQLGGWFGYFDYIYNKNVFRLLNYWHEKKALNQISLYLTASVIERDFLAANFPKIQKYLFLNGIDFDEFPLVEKKQAKQKLGIAFENKIILYVGRYNKTKSVDLIIQAFKKIEKDKPDVELYLVGGYETDEFYQMGKNAGAKMILKSGYSIRDYYAAADVYLMPITEPLVRDFGGFGIAPIEALACGTPIVTNNLIHFPGSEEERKKLGITFGRKENLAEAIEKVFTNEYTECRQVAKKYFDINSNSNKLIGLYKSVTKNN